MGEMGGWLRTATGGSPIRYRSRAGVSPEYHACRWLVGGLQVACRALWPPKSKDSGDCGLSGQRGSEKAAGTKQNKEISGKRAEFRRPRRERGCSEYVAGGGQGGWPATHSLGLVCQTSKNWLAWRNSMGPTGG